MATTADYLNKLIMQKNTLADNLITKGVIATHDETFETLVPKVLEISGGSQAMTPESLGYVSNSALFFDGEYNWVYKHGNNGLAWIDMCNDNVIIRKNGTVNEKYYVKKSDSNNIFKSLNSIDYDYFTAEIVCNITAVNTTSENNLFSTFDSSGFGAYIENNNINTTIYDTNQYKSISLGSVIINQIQTISMTFDGSTMKGFLNGVEIGEQNITNYVKSSTILGVGGSGTDKYFNYEMNIYRFSLYDRALTISEITQNYNADVIRFRQD